jgi:hypothetical protein
MGVFHDLINLPVSQFAKGRAYGRERKADVVLFASKIAQLQAPAHTFFPVLLRCGSKQT